MNNNLFKSIIVFASIFSRVVASSKEDDFLEIFGKTRDDIDSLLRQIDSKEETSRGIFGKTDTDRTSIFGKANATGKDPSADLKIGVTCEPLFGSLASSSLQTTGEEKTEDKKAANDAEIKFVLKTDESIKDCCPIYNIDIYGSKLKQYLMPLAELFLTLHPVGKVKNPGSAYKLKPRGYSLVIINEESGEDVGMISWQSPSIEKRQIDQMYMYPPGRQKEQGRYSSAKPLQQFNFGNGTIGLPVFPNGKREDKKREASTVIFKSSGFADLDKPIQIDLTVYVMKKGLMHQTVKIDYLTNQKSFDIVEQKIEDWEVRDGELCITRVKVGLRVENEEEAGLSLFKDYQYDQGKKIAIFVIDFENGLELKPGYYMKSSSKGRNIYVQISKDDFETKEIVELAGMALEQKEKEARKIKEYLFNLFNRLASRLN